MPRGADDHHLSSAEARTALPTIVREAAALPEPAGRLDERAYRVGRYNRESAWIVPAIDAEAAIERERLLEVRVDELESLAENLQLYLMLEQRSQEAREPGATLLTPEELAEQLGFTDLIEQPARTA